MQKVFTMILAVLVLFSLAIQLPAEDLGSITMPIGMMRLSKNWAPHSAASGIAEQYNRELLEDIKSN